MQKEDEMLGNPETITASNRGTSRERSRGRPKGKAKAKASSSNEPKKAQPASSSNEPMQPDEPKKPRGRPPKKIVDMQSENQQTRRDRSGSAPVANTRQ